MRTFHRRKILHLEDHGLLTCGVLVDATDLNEVADLDVGKEFRVQHQVICEKTMSCLIQAHVQGAVRVIRVGDHRASTRLPSTPTNNAARTERSARVDQMMRTLRQVVVVDPELVRQRAARRLPAQHRHARRRCEAPARVRQVRGLVGLGLGVAQLRLDGCATYASSAPSSVATHLPPVAKRKREEDEIEVKRDEDGDQDVRLAHGTGESLSNSPIGAA